MRSIASSGSSTATRLLVAACALLLAQCAVTRPGPERFVFGVMGDTPYNEREEKHFVAMIGHMNDEPLAFVVHVGDFKGGGPCSDALFIRRKMQFDASAHPFVFVPGDNEWVDCRDPAHGAAAPLERLAKLRAIFFSDGLSLGARRMPMERQCTDAAPAACGCTSLPENRLWQHAGVVFATINVQGSNNNRGFDPAGDRDADCRDAANLLWLAHAEERAAGSRALVVMTQANLWWADARTLKAYRDALAALAQRYRKPVLFVHGDSHTYRVDTPFVDGRGLPITNPTRLETYGSPAVGWVRVTVDTSRPDIFTFEPRLAAVVPRRIW